MPIPRPDPRGGFLFSFSPKQFGLRWALFSKIPKPTKNRTKTNTHTGEVFAMAYGRRVQHFMASIAKTECVHSHVNNTFGELYVNLPVGCMRALVPWYAVFPRTGTLEKQNSIIGACMQLGILQQYVLSGDGCFSSVCLV